MRRVPGSTNITGPSSATPHNCPASRRDRREMSSKYDAARFSSMSRGPAFAGLWMHIQIPTRQRRTLLILTSLVLFGGDPYANAQRRTRPVCILDRVLQRRPVPGDSRPPAAERLALLASQAIEDR